MLQTLFATLVCLSLVINAPCQSGKKPVIIGYVGGYRGLIDTATIDVTKLTHINYAFIDIKDNRAWLHREFTDTTNLRNLVLLKQKNPALKILISIGGWSWSKNFSDAMLTDSSRKAFATSAVDIVRTYNLDGIDIDWEYPNMRGDSNTYRPEDKHNYTLMFAALRQEFRTVKNETAKKYLLTTAVGGFPSFIKNTEMAQVQQYLDYVNLMTYDYGYGTSGHNASLYHSKRYEEENSADNAVRIFLSAGVPAAKMVLGLPFYGRGWLIESTANRGLNQKVISGTSSGGYTFIKDSLVNKNGYKRYWDRKAKAPYLLQKKDKKFISYEDERSVRKKCRYVKEKRLAGVMFWEYFSDSKGYLLRAVNRSLY